MTFHVFGWELKISRKSTTPKSQTAQDTTLREDARSRQGALVRRLIPEGNESCPVIANVGVCVCVYI